MRCINGTELKCEDYEMHRQGLKNVKKEGGKIPHITAPCLLLRQSWEAPTSIQLYTTYSSCSSLVSTTTSLSSSDSSASKMSQNMRKRQDSGQKLTQ